MHDYKARNIIKARQLWEEARASDPQASGLHPRLVAYLAARGIDVGRLPDRVTPWSLRYLERCLDTEGLDPAAQRYVHHYWPAMVAPIVFGKQVQGVHRTYLHPVEARKRTEEDAPGRGATKKMLGHAEGGVIRLGTRYTGGVLILTEGIETGLAVMQATGMSVWAAGSAGSLPECIEHLPRELFDPEAKGGKGVHTVVVAADLNRPAVKRGSTVVDAAAARFLEAVTKDETLKGVLGGMLDVDVEVGRWSVRGVGERMARWAMWRLEARCPWVTGVVRAPTFVAAPDLIERGEEVFGDVVQRPMGRKGGIDWLDVMQAARARGLDVAQAEAVVRAGVLAGLEGVDGNGGERARARFGAYWGGVGAKGDEEQGEGGWQAESAAADEEAGPRAEGPSLGVGGAGGADDGRGGWSGGGFGGGGAGGGGAPWDVYEFGANRPVIDVGPLERARRFLWERMRRDGARRFLLARWGAKWWFWADGRYVEVDDETLRGEVLHWLGGFDEVVDSKLRRFRPGSRTVKEVMDSLVSDTAVYAAQPPTMIAATIDEQGRPRWGSAANVHELSRQVDRDDRQPPLVAFKNGSLDMTEVIRSGRVVLRPHDPRLFATSRLPFDLSVEDAHEVLAGGEGRDMCLHRMCPNWMRWLGLASGGVQAWEDQLQEMMGDTMSMDRTIEKVYMAVGKQRAGKGIIQEALVAVLGSAAVVSTTFTALTSDRYALFPLVGKAAAIMPDAHVSSFSEGPQAVEILKTISGQDRVQVRDLYTSYQTVRLSCRFWIFANEEPNLRDESSAFANRVVMLPLEHSALGQEDPTIKASIASEAAGIMLWALEGAVRLARRKPRRIVLADESSRLQAEMERASAPLKAFVADCIVEDRDGVGLTAVELYEAYTWWCEHEGREPMKQPRFFSLIKWHLPGSMTWKQPRVGESRKRRVQGLAIRDDIARQIDGDGPTMPAWHDQP